MNYKGLLQEYCQKRGMSLPKYNTTFTNGKFVSSVIVNDYFYEISERLTTYDTKKEAEQVIAEYALSQIEKKNESEKHSFNIHLTEEFQPTTSLFIDIENKQTILNDLEERINMDCFSNHENGFQDSVYFYVFISKYHHLYKKIKDTKYCAVFEIDSPNKDAADVYMTYMCASLGEDFKNIGIVTGDHFGHTLVQILKDEDKNSRLLRDIDDIIDFFEEIQ
jgi:hypothetical protein